MEHLWSKCQLAIVITITGLLHLAELSDVVTGFQRCYNTTEDTHCFYVQHDTTNNRSLTASFDNARQRCNGLRSTLVIIQDEDTNEVFQQFMTDTDNPIRSQSVWTDAYLFNDFDKSYRFQWKWLDSTLPNIPAWNVVLTPDDGWYVAALEFDGNNFRLTGQQPYFGNRYVCEYRVSKCLSIISTNVTVRQFDNKCYTAGNETANWYEARNRCLKGGGDLASFANLSSISFTSWLASDTNIRYWIGLRFAGYRWIDSGEDVKFAKCVNYGDGWAAPCLVACFGPSCGPSFSWYAKFCNATDVVNVVCHKATTLHPTTTSTSTTSSTFTSVGFVTPSYSSLETSKSSDRPSISSKRLAIGIGVGLGVGIPIIIAVIVILIYIFKRSGKSAEPKTPRDTSELSTIRKPTVAQQSDSANDHYQQLNRSQDNCSGTEYEKLGVQPERRPQENPSNGTLANSEIYEIVDNH